MADTPLILEDLRQILSILVNPNRTATTVIAAPYAPLPGLTIQDNINRAVWLGRLAVTIGLAPITPHLLWPVLSNDPDEKDSNTREMSLHNSQAHAEAVARAGGDMWVLAKPGKERTLSAGCLAEFNTFFVNAKKGQAILLLDWETAGQLAQELAKQYTNYPYPGVGAELNKLYSQWQQLPKGGRMTTDKIIEANLRRQGFVQKTAPDGVVVWVAPEHQPPMGTPPEKVESIKDCIAAAIESLFEAESRLEFWEEAKLVGDFEVSALLRVQFLLENPEWIPILAQIQATTGTFPIAPDAHIAIEQDKLAFLKRYHLIELHKGHDYPAYQTTHLGRRVWGLLPRFLPVAKDSVVQDALKNLIEDKNFHHAFHYPQYVSAAERKTQLVSRGLWDERQMAPTELGKAVSAALHEYLRSDQLSDEEIRLYLRTHRQLLRAMREHCCCASEVDIAQLVSLGLIVKVLDGWNVVTLRTGKGWRVLRLM